MIEFVGIDPDTKTSGIALIHDNGEIELMLARAKGRKVADRMVEMSRALRRAIPDFRPICVNAKAAVEWQHIRRVERNPNSMMGVQAVSGMAVAALSDLGFRDEDVEIPIPSEWKGSVSKQAMHPRILKEAGLTMESAEFDGIPQTMRQHVIDALGMALWLKRGKRLR